MSLIIGITVCLAILLILTAGLVIGVTYIIMHKIYVPMVYKTMNMTTEEFFAEFALIIENEIKLYEKSVFENGGQFIVKDSTFENYYKTICERIGENIPPEFYQKFKYYMTEESAKRFIARTVRAYLETKIPEF